MIYIFNQLEWEDWTLGWIANARHGVTRKWRRQGEKRKGKLTTKNKKITGA